MVSSVASVWSPNIFITPEENSEPFNQQLRTPRMPPQPWTAVPVFALPRWISLFWMFPTNGPTVWNLCVWLLTRSVVFRALRVVAGVRTSRMLLGPSEYSTGQADYVSVPTRLAMDLGFSRGHCQQCCREHSCTDICLKTSFCLFGELLCPVVILCLTVDVPTTGFRSGCPVPRAAADVGAV